MNNKEIEYLKDENGKLVKCRICEQYAKYNIDGFIYCSKHGSEILNIINDLQKYQETSN